MNERTTPEIQPSRILDLVEKHMFKISMTIITLLAIGIGIGMTISDIYKTNPESPILEKIGIPPHPNVITRNYIETNIETIIDDIRIQMELHIPALPQIDDNRMRELIQNNVKFRYDAERVRNYTHKITATAHIDISLTESEELTGHIAGTFPFLLIMNRKAPEETQYYIQHEQAYFISNLPKPSGAFKEAGQNFQASN